MYIVQYTRIPVVGIQKNSKEIPYRLERENSNETSTIENSTSHQQPIMTLQCPQHIPISDWYVRQAPGVPARALRSRLLQETLFAFRRKILLTVAPNDFVYSRTGRRVARPRTQTMYFPADCGAEALAVSHMVTSVTSAHNRIQWLIRNKE